MGKLTWRWRVTKKAKVTGSLRLLLGFEGAQDYAEYNNEVLGQSTLSLTEDGRTEAFEGSAFLNLGANYEQYSGLRLNLQLHNALGWIDSDVNKRNFFGRMAGYRDEAAAVTLGVQYGI